MPIPLRGLRTVRTLAGKMTRVCVPHRAHLQIACLEIEKARRATERTTALRRVSEIDARLRQIDTEEAAIVQSLAEFGKAKRVDLPGAGGGFTSRRTAGAFRLRY